MEAVDLDITRIRTVVAMFRLSQGELARASGASPAMVSLVLGAKKRPSARIAVALVHGIEKLLSGGRRLDTAFFIPDAGRSAHVPRGANVIQSQKEVGARAEPE